jgi:5-methylcytosine-specific restriction endonuclease McrA
MSEKVTAADVDRCNAEVDAAWALYRGGEFPPLLMQRRRWMLQRYEEQRGLCIYCGDIMIVMTAAEVKSRPDIAPLRATCDHVTPRALGGEDTLDNVVAACSGCNTIKGDIAPVLFAHWILHGQSRGLDPFQMRGYLSLEASAFRYRQRRAKAGA